MRVGGFQKNNNKPKIKNIMKQIIDDIKAENFTKKEFIVYGIIAPLALVVVTILGGLLA